MEKSRCPWAQRSSVEKVYHDQEWGYLKRDDRTLFMWLVLEGAQAGLSWRTVLEKRQGYEVAFAGFDPWRVAAFGDEDERRLLNESGIVRNRLKIRSAINNARALIALVDREGAFCDFLLEHAGGQRSNLWPSQADLPSQTPESRRLSRELVRHGFSFVGPVIIYSFMQATGLVNDHIEGCFRANECA